MSARGRGLLAICISDFHVGERYGGITDNPGHTHVPSFGETFVRYQDQKKMPLDIHNKGGWVNINPDTFHMPQPTLIDKNGAVRQLRFRYADS
jgi:hypothetical protein